MVRISVLCIVYICMFHFAAGQNEDDLRLWASEIMESLAADLDEDVDLTWFTEELIRLARNPVRINRARREDLEQIFFLNDIQIEAILFRRYQLEKFVTIFDLQAVEGLDRRTIMLLEPLLLFDEEPDDDHRFFRRRGDLFFRSQWVLETPSGYREREDGSTPFQGNKLKLYSRMEMEPMRDVELGFVTEKDAGEPMFNNQINTLDYVSGYLSWKPNGIVKQVIVGQYRMSTGQGLVLQTAMAPRKSSMTTSIRNRHQSYRPSLSVAESGGLNGGLIAFGTDNFTVVPFVSIQNVGGRISEDDDGNRFITSIKTDGFHRTLTELKQRKTTREEIYGISARWHAGRFILDAGFLHYELEYPLYPVDRPYNIHYFRGSKNQNGWFGWQGSIYNVHWFGEVAFNDNPEPAVWTGTLFALSGQLNMAVAYRRIPVDFIAPLGAPLTEAGNPAGESGFYAGMELGLPAGLSLSAYIDYFEHNWLRFQTKSPSNGYDFLSVLTLRPSRGWENLLRYRYRSKMVNIPMVNPGYETGELVQNQFRLQTRYSPDNTWSFTTRADFHYVSRFGERTESPGFLLAQDVRYRHPGDRWNATLRYAMMDVDDYETRIYAYEPDLLYSFSVPSYYGVGNRVVAMVKYTPLRRLDLWVRFSRWHYANRETIGSGNMTIPGNVSREVRFQLRKRF
ncbi:ComEA family DNA-binding protein [Alkalitalea saponilacus]|uniref:Helix-hairpin-helix motif-containing protein n=1 Tax=Alkalitalea saponilacus TaxID=889453 RepID=A0A1T5ADW2_9BACT|nr:helix-hairpin-helix domain-containing protein [Alkalitalea saponilacus]ASB48735.1 hypothetical protein CDL62_06080 [Alkalitalea saponilacus]SKB33222.1 Helix-hairpin-helix motif-containing protein [Alkalitalea saponilacus]